MRKRNLGRSGQMVTEIGLGGEHLQGKPYAVVEEVVHAALDAGMNIMDIFMSEPQVRSDIGKALGKRRGDMLLQAHIGSAWLEGQYAVTRDPEHCRFFFEDYLQRLDTDYIDIGMLHFVDKESDFHAVFEGPVIDYAMQLKKEGRIRLLGMSSHDPRVARMAVETGLLDVLMFSINPAFDLLPTGVTIEEHFGEDIYKSGLVGQDEERQALYRACESAGVGITVMKALGAGLLLNAEASPLGFALTEDQCLAYALDRPGVASALVGCISAGQVEMAAAYEKVGSEQRDYAAALRQAAQFQKQGRCMYCNHCLPCPGKIDIAQVNKYLDMAELSETIPATLREHYHALSATASDCIDCGVCEKRCPFQVPVIQRMDKARRLFG